MKRWGLLDGYISCLHNDACLCLDELGQVSAKVLHEATYMLANGQGKRRAGQDGTARTSKTWRTVILSTGEKTISEKIAEDGRKVNAGQLIRILDISADTGLGLGVFENLHSFESSRLFSEAIKTACNTHYGHLAPMFIQKFIDNEKATEEIKTILPKIINSLCENKEVDGQVQRVAKKFALAIVSAEKAVEWGLLPWEKWEAFNACKKVFSEWLVQRGGIGSHEDMAIYEQIMLFIEQHGKSRFQDLDHEETICINRVGFRKKIENGVIYYILPQSFKNELCRGIDPIRTAKILLEKGLLLKDKGRNLAKLSPFLPDFGRIRCYTIIVDGNINV